jgi:hypothetical protein
MSRGPLEFVVIEFPHGVPGKKLGPALTSLADKGIVNLIDIVFVSKDTDGTITTFEMADRDGDGEFEALDVAVQSIDGLVADQDLAEIARDLRAGSTGMVLLFEHLWVRNIRDIVAGAGGQVVLSERIPAPVAEAVEALAYANQGS